MNKRPMIFKRGGSFSTTFTIPAEYSDGHFAGWLPLAQVRCESNTSPATSHQNLRTGSGGLDMPRRGLGTFLSDIAISPTNRGEGIPTPRTG